jgi:hypothetical protein
LQNPSIIGRRFRRLRHKATGVQNDFRYAKHPNSANEQPYRFDKRRKGWLDMIDIQNWQEEMLAFNPWALEAWKKRAQLVDAKVWNLNALDQAGNQRTSKWLEAFRAKRKQASLQRWRQGRQAWSDWAANTQQIIDAFRSANLWDTRRPGSAMIPKQNGFLVNMSPIMPEYTIDFLMADILLLARADFSGLEIEAEADFSGHDFPAGVLFCASCIGNDVNFEATNFGERAYFSGNNTRIGARAHFHKARFERWASFTMTSIGAEADFSDAIFGFAGDFEAATFAPGGSFKRAKFGDSFSFAGAEIGDDASFDDARFGKDATFEDAGFGKNVSFDRVAFEGRAAMPKLGKHEQPSFRGARFNGPQPRHLKYGSE